MAESGMTDDEKLDHEVRVLNERVKSRASNFNNGGALVVTVGILTLIVDLGYGKQTIIAELGGWASLILSVWIAVAAVLYWAGHNALGKLE